MGPLKRGPETWHPTLGPCRVEIKLSGLLERTGLRKRCKRRDDGVREHMFSGSQFTAKRRHSYEHL